MTNTTLVLVVLVFVIAVIALIYKGVKVSPGKNPQPGQKTPAPTAAPPTTKNSVANPSKPAPKSAPPQAPTLTERHLSISKSPTMPGAACAYIFSSATLQSNERQEALWKGFFSNYPRLDRSVAENIELRAAVIGVSPAWSSDNSFEHATNLAESAIRGVFKGEHSGGSYLDAILIYPNRPPSVVLLVWNASETSRIMRLIPEVKRG